MATATPPCLRLVDGALDCVLAPALGGCLLALRWNGHDVLRPAPLDIDTARQAASYPLVPWSNRIGHGMLRWRGRTWALHGHNGGEPHPIHGIGWQDAWEVLHAMPREARLRLRHAGDARWPFAFECTQRLAVADGVLAMELAITNQAGDPMPGGVGWHPFFVKRPGARLRLRTRGRWEMGDDKLPTTHAAHGGLDTCCDGLDLDHCFDGWDGQAQLQDEVLRVTLSSTLDHVVVFTRPERDVVAIEPASHANNAFGDARIAALGAAAGARELAPGERFTATTWIRVGPANG
jgi:aldose 1-epimerase